MLHPFLALLLLVTVPCDAGTLYLNIVSAFVPLGPSGSSNPYATAVYGGGKTLFCTTQTISGTTTPSWGTSCSTPAGLPSGTTLIAYTNSGSTLTGSILLTSRTGAIVTQTLNSAVGGSGSYTFTYSLLYVPATAVVTSFGVTTPANTPITIDFSSKITYEDFNLLFLASVSAPTSGTLSLTSGSALAAGGNTTAPQLLLVFSPVSNQGGIVTFSYSASDSYTTSAPAVVTVTVLDPSPSQTPTVSATASVSPTVSVTPSPSSTATETSSATASLSPSPSFSPTASFTATRTQTRSPTATATQTRSSTVTVTSTRTATSTATVTKTISRTPTTSASASMSSTITPTESASASDSASDSASASASMSSSWTRTSSRSQTKSTSGTATFSVTASTTRSSSRTLTTTASATATSTTSATFTRSSSSTASSTASATITVTPTRTTTKSATVSSSFTASLSESASVTDTRTASRTATASVTGSRSTTPTTTATSTATDTRTASRTGSSTATLTVSATGTKTTTASPSNTKTSTASLTATRSATVTGTVTRTVTRTSTTTTSASPSVTMTATDSASGSASPSVTPSASGSSTASVSSTATDSTTSTASASETATPSSTDTVSPSASVSASATDTPTVSSTPSQTQSSTVTVSASASSSTTATFSCTHTSTSTPSATVSASVSGSPSVTASVTVSASASVTMTASATESASWTASATPSYSVTPSLSGTVSATPSDTPSSDPSRTSTPSITPSDTASPSQTPTDTKTGSVTSTASDTATRSSSPSGSRSATATDSGSITATASSTYTVSATATPTASSSESPSASTSPSTTVTASATVTATASRTASGSQTVTATYSASATFTRSPSASVTGTASASVSVSPSRSCSGTPSVTFSGSASASGSVTVSVTATSSVTSTLTTSGSLSSTPTESASASDSETPSASVSDSSSATASSSSSESLSATDSATDSASSSVSSSLTVSGSYTVSGSATPTNSATDTASGSASASQTWTSTASTSSSASASISPSCSSSAPSSPSPSESGTPQPSVSSTESGTPQASSSQTESSSTSGSVSVSYSASASESSAPSQSASTSSSVTASSVPSVTLSPSRTVSASAQETASKTASKSGTPSYSSTSTASVSPSSTATSSDSSLASSSATSSVSESMLPSPSESFSGTTSSSDSGTPSASPPVSATASASRSPSASRSGSASPSPAASATPSPTGTVIFLPVPLVTLDGSRALWAEHGPAVPAMPSVLVSSAASILRADVQIDSGFALGDDTLGAPAAAQLTFTWNAQTGVLSVVGSASASVYQSMLRAVTFVSANGNPQVQPRNVSVTVWNMFGPSEPAWQAVDVLAVNDAPIGPPVLTVYGVENDASIVFELPGSDVDSTMLFGRISTFPPLGSLYIWEPDVGNGRRLGLGAALTPATPFTTINRTVAFVAEPGAYGSPYVNFWYRLSDGVVESAATTLVRVFITSSSSPVLQTGTGGRLGAVTDASGTVRVPEGGSLALGLRLASSPDVDEVVSVFCSSSQPNAGFFNPSVAVFTAQNFSETSPVTLWGAWDRVNGHQADPYTLTCLASSFSPTPATARFGLSTTTIPAVTFDVMFPYFGDFLVQRSSSWESSLSQNGAAFAPTTSGDEVVRLLGDSSMRLLGGPAFSAGLVVTLGGITVPAVVLDGGMALQFRTPPYADLCPTEASCAGASAYKPLLLRNPDGGSAACPGACPGSIASGGVFYTHGCPGFTNGSVCLEPSTAQLCGLQVGSTCQSCPAGGMCPGGNRLWPLAGRWVPADNATQTQQCRIPRSKRCVGWDVVANAALCGPGYDASAPLCGACSSGWSPRPSGFCEVCPYGASVGVALFVALMVYVSVVIVLLAVAFLASWRRGGLFRHAFWESFEFCAYSATSLHVLIVVFNASVPGLNTVVQKLYRTMQLFLIDVKAVVQPQCQQNMPLLHIEALQFVGGICLVLALVVVKLLHRPVDGADTVEPAGSRKPASRKPDLAQQRRSAKDAIAATVATAAAEAGYESAPRALDVDGLADARVDTVVLDTGTAYEHPSSTIAMAGIAGSGNRDAWVQHRVRLSPEALAHRRNTRCQRALLFVMTLMYPVICISWFRMVDCVTPLGSAHAVLRFDTSIRCYAAAHAYTGALAWACFCAYVVGWPLTSFAYLVFTRKRHQAFMEDAYGAWAFYFRLEARSYWVRHFDIAMLFLLSIIVSRALDTPGAVLGGTLALLTVYAAVLLWKEPYQPAHRWRMVFKLAVLGVAALAAILNYVLYLATEARHSRFASAGTVLSFVVYVATILLLVALLYKLWSRLLRVTSLRPKKQHALVASADSSILHTKSGVFSTLFSAVGGRFGASSRSKRPSTVGALDLDAERQPTTNLDDVTLQIGEPIVEVEDNLDDLAPETPRPGTRQPAEGQWADNDVPPHLRLEMQGQRQLSVPRHVRSVLATDSNAANADRLMQRSARNVAADNPLSSVTKADRGVVYRAGYGAVKARGSAIAGAPHDVEAVPVELHQRGSTVAASGAAAVRPAASGSPSAHADRVPDVLGRSAAIRLLTRRPPPPPPPLPAQSQQQQDSQDSQHK